MTAVLARGPLEFAMLHAAGNLKNTFEAATLPHDFRWSAVRGPRALAAPLRARLSLYWADRKLSAGYG